MMKQFAAKGLTRMIHLATQASHVVASNIGSRLARIRAGCALALGLLSLGIGVQPAKASTDCEARIEKIWAGDGGYIWVHLIGGGAAVLQPNDPNKESVIAMGLTALTGSRKVVLRYAANNANCNEFGRQDFVGLYLY